MPALVQHFLDISDNRYVVKLHKQQKRRNKRKQKKRGPVRNMEQFQNLHQIDHIEIADSEIDQETHCRWKSPGFAVKNKSWKSYRKTNISDE